MINKFQLVGVSKIAAAIDKHDRSSYNSTIWEHGRFCLPRYPKGIVLLNPPSDCFHPLSSLPLLLSLDIFSTPFHLFLKVVVAPRLPLRGFYP